MSNTPPKEAPTTPAKAAEPRAPKDPLASAQDMAQRLADDAEALLLAAADGAHKVIVEGVHVSHDVVQAGLDSIAIVRNKLGLAERALRNAATKATRS